MYTCSSSSPNDFVTWWQPGVQDVMLPLSKFLFAQNCTWLESHSTSCYWIQINISFQEPTVRLVWSAAQHRFFAWYSIGEDCEVKIKLKSYN